MFNLFTLFLVAIGLSMDTFSLSIVYGTIGLTLAKVYHVDTTMIDINNRALALAEKNATLNNVAVDIFQSDIYENVTKQFDYIVSNPPIRAGKAVVHQVISGA